MVVSSKTFARYLLSMSVIQHPLSKQTSDSLVVLDDDGSHDAFMLAYFHPWKAYPLGLLLSGSIEDLTLIKPV